MGCCSSGYAQTLSIKQAQDNSFSIQLYIKAQPPANEIRQTQNNSQSESQSDYDQDSSNQYDYNQSQNYYDNSESQDQDQESEKSYETNLQEEEYQEEEEYQQEEEYQEEEEEYQEEEEEYQEEEYQEEESEYSQDQEKSSQIQQNNEMGSFLNYLQEGISSFNQNEYLTQIFQNFMDVGMQLQQQEIIQSVQNQDCPPFWIDFNKAEMFQILKLNKSNTQSDQIYQYLNELDISNLNIQANSFQDFVYKYMTKQ